MVMAVDRVAETVLLTTKPSYRETSVYSLLQVDGHRRHKQEIKLFPALKPVKYADTAFLLLNNTRKRFRSRTYYQPRLNQKSFADTTFATPKSVQERFVSSLDLHADQLNKRFKTSIEIKPRVFKFKSSVSYPNIESLSSTSGHLTNGFFPHSHSSSGNFNDNDNDNDNDVDNHNNDYGEDEVDENMNHRVPSAFREKYDPGASQVFIPKRKDYNFSTRSAASSQDLLLDSISDQILVNHSLSGGNRNNDLHGSNNDNLCNGYANLNGHASNNYSDL